MSDIILLNDWWLWYSYKAIDKMIKDYSNYQMNINEILMFPPNTITIDDYYIS